MADDEKSSRKTRLYLLLSEPQAINHLNIAVLKKILDRGCNPLIISLNQPGAVMTKAYSKEGVSPDIYYIVDAVTRYSGGSTVPMPALIRSFSPRCQPLSTR